MVLIHVLGKKGSSRNSVLSVLSKQWPLSAKELHREVNKISASEVSYQAVHQLVNLLEEDGVLEKQGSKFLISKNYIEELKRTGSELEQAYSVEKKPELKTEQKTFNSVIDLGRFILFEFYNYPKAKEVPTVCHWHAMYSLIGLSKQEIAQMKKQTKDKKFWVLCQGKSFVDSFLANAFEQFGVKVKLGVPCAFTCDLIVVGDFIMEIYYEPEHKKIWKKMWENTKNIHDFDLNKELDSMFGKHPIRVVIFEDASVAEQIREQAKKEFQKS